MGGVELEAQVVSHAFDGELGACHGMDHGERAVDHIVSDTPKSLFNSPHSPPYVQSAPRADAREAPGCLDVRALFDPAAQVFGDFVYALKCGAGLFVGAMSCANATLSAVGASALTINAHAHGDKRNADNSQYNNIDRCHSKPPLVNHHLLYPILHLPKRGRFILVGFICGNATSPSPKSPSVAGTPGLVERG